MVFDNYSFGTKEYDKQEIERQQVKVDLMKYGVAKVFTEADKYDDEVLHEAVKVMCDEFDLLELKIQQYEEKYGDNDNESQQQ